MSILTKLERKHSKSTKLLKSIGFIRKLISNLDHLVFVIESLSIKPDLIEQQINLGKREQFLKSLPSILKTKYNFKKISNLILPRMESYLSSNENMKLQNHIKSKIRKILKLLETEKKVQYELNRFKLLQSATWVKNKNSRVVDEEWRRHINKSTNTSSPPTRNKFVLTVDESRWGRLEQIFLWNLIYLLGRLIIL